MGRFYTAALASPGYRLLAVLIDATWFSLLMVPVARGLAQLTPREPELLAAPASSILGGAIVFLFWVTLAATPGKLLFRLRITDAETGAPPTARQCLIRLLAGKLCLLSLGLGYVWILFDPRRQGWHDKLAGTLVVSVTPSAVSSDTPA